MIHIYTGDGKGKTTAAVGLAVRAAAQGKKVLFFQFLKSDKSGEIKILSDIDNITVIPVGEDIPFLCDADEFKINSLKELYKKKLDFIISISDEYDMFIFDEAVCALDCKIITTSRIEYFFDKGEVVLTGRGDISEIEKYADYITVMQKIKHPYDSGISARQGIEF